MNSRTAYCNASERTKQQRKMQMNEEITKNPK
jgi:hypothetical protein